MTFLGLASVLLGNRYKYWMQPGRIEVALQTRFCLSSLKKDGQLINKFTSDLEC